MEGNVPTVSTVESPPLQTGSDDGREDAAREERRPLPVSGQALVIFALAIVVLMGLTGIVIDVSWYWANTLRIQRAADAAALAGAVRLPGDAGKGMSLALAEAKKNGYGDGTSNTYDSGTNTCTLQPLTLQICARQNQTNSRQMDVTIAAPVPTFFIQIFGIRSIPAKEDAKAMFTLPVPMGSPLNAFGDPNAMDLSGNKLNFWAAIQGANTAKENGDPYATRVLTPGGQPNPEYVAPSQGNPGAYNYGIEVPAGWNNGSITISLYDPEFCERSSQWFDTGETAGLYPGGGGTANDTTFTLYDISDTPYDHSQDTQLAQTTYHAGCDSTHVSGSGGNYTGKWTGATGGPPTYYTIGNPKPGVYRLNVQSTLSGNLSNVFAIRAVANGGAGTQPQVYGLGSMSIYANVNAGITNLYLAEIDQVYAGKTAEIRLFDPGDASGDASLQVLIPTDPTNYAPVSFTYYDAGVNGDLHPAPSGPTSTLVTTTGGNRLYNGHWVVLDAVIPSGYTAPQGGWWKIAYNYTSQAHDRTTWQVSILGNPVHLTLP